MPGPYALRHTFATWALDAGIDIFDLARLMGTSVQVIDSTYGHLARGQAERARDWPSLARLLQVSVKSDSRW